MLTVDCRLSGAEIKDIKRPASACVCGCKVRDKNGDTVKLQRYYMIYTLSEAFEMFFEQHPGTKISWLAFCNCIPDHVMLRANTPANICLFTYHKKMRLLVSNKLSKTSEKQFKILTGLEFSISVLFLSLNIGLSETNFESGNEILKSSLLAKL